VLESIGCLNLSKKERSQYLTLLRDLPYYEWILERISDRDKVILIGSDLAYLKSRILNPIKYHRDGYWNKTIHLWLAIAPRFHSPSGTNISVTDGSTLSTYRVPLKVYQQRAEDPSWVILNRNRYGKYRTMSTITTSFVPSPEGLERWLSGSDGWIFHKRDDISKIQILEYHSVFIRPSMWHTRLYAHIRENDEIALKLLSIHMAKMEMDTKVSTLYAPLHIDPKRVNVCRGRQDTTKVKWGMNILVHRQVNSIYVHRSRLRIYVR
jgi:hypothetical protein